MAKHLELRRSSLVGTFGPGAIVDLRTPAGAPVSGIVGGLEAWDQVAKHRGLSHPQVIHEPRLQKKLHVRGFRLPPVHSRKIGEELVDVLNIVRFPRWLQCPSCSRLKPDEHWNDSGPGWPELFCRPCSDSAGGQVFVVPVRFIVACQNGHIDDFPWKLWAGCECPQPDLYLQTKAAGLGGKVVECRRCAKARTLEGIFGKFALSSYSCSGRRPWLTSADETCTQPPRALQRGASNVYWDVTESALDIPPFSLDLADVFGRYSHLFENRKPEDWPELIRLLRIAEETGRSEGQLLDYLRRYSEALAGDQADELEPAEFAQLELSCVSRIDAGEFKSRPEPAPPEVESWIGGLAVADRLREVRALKGFTRIDPPAGPFRSSTQRMARLSRQAQQWLPAVEMLGEGIFVKLNRERLEVWEQEAAVQARFSEFLTQARTDLSESETLDELAPRHVLLHTLSHVLMRQLSMTSGYGSAALRERLYVDRKHGQMCGLLIHTGSNDSEGTLGGLVAQGTTDRFYDLLVGGLQEARWCSQDPVCILGTATLSSPRNMAACHACLLAPETSCQWFNSVLDRAMLIGTPEEPEIGYFSELVSQLDIQ